MATMRLLHRNVCTASYVACAILAYATAHLFGWL